MKSKTMRAMTLFMALVLSLTLAACGGGKGNDLAGITWALSGGSQGDVSVDKDTLEGILGGEMTFSFEKDGKVTFAMAGMEAEGTWSQDGNTISIESQGQSMSLTLDGDKLTMEQSGVTIEFTKK